MPVLETKEEFPGFGFHEASDICAVMVSVPFYILYTYLYQSPVSNRESLLKCIFKFYYHFLVHVKDPGNKRRKNESVSISCERFKDY